jgi:hypothetical protein
VTGETGGGAEGTKMDKRKEESSGDKERLKGGGVYLTRIV